MGQLTEDMILEVLHVRGTLTAPEDAFGDREVSSGDPLGVTKARHAPLQWTDLGLGVGDTIVAEERIVHVANGAETIRGFRAMLNSAITNGGTASFDLKKNGSSILSSTVDFSSSDSNRDVKTGTLSSTSLASGDVLSVESTVSTSPDGTGPFAVAELDVRMT